MHTYFSREHVIDITRNETSGGVHFAFLLRLGRELPFAEHIDANYSDEQQHGSAQQETESRPLRLRVGDRTHHHSHTHHCGLRPLSHYLLTAGDLVLHHRHDYHVN